MSGPRVSDLGEIAGASLVDSDYYLYACLPGASQGYLKHSVLNPSDKETTVTAAYTITKDNEIVFASGTFTVTLPAATYAFRAKIANIGTGTVTVACAGSDTIEGSTSIVLPNQYDSVTLQANGGALWVEF